MLKQCKTGTGRGSGGNQQAASASSLELAATLLSTSVIGFFEFEQIEPKFRCPKPARKAGNVAEKFGSVSLTLEGHADERGTREYNLALGERRANSAKDFLVALGIAPNRIRVISYGKERPAALGQNETAWRQNRRAVTIVAGASGS